MVALEFQNILTTGTAITALLLVIIAGTFALRDRLTTKWKDLYSLADTERKEITAKYNECLERNHSIELEIEKLKAQTDFSIVRTEQQHFHQELVHALSDIASTNVQKYEEMLGKIGQTAERNYDLLNEIRHEMRQAWVVVSTTVDTLKSVIDSLRQEINGGRVHDD